MMKTDRDTTPKIAANDRTLHGSCSCLQIAEILQKLISNPEIYVQQMWNTTIPEESFTKSCKELQRDADRFFTWLPFIDTITFRSESSIAIRFSNRRELQFQVSQELYFHIRNAFFKK